MKQSFPRWLSPRWWQQDAAPRIGQGLSLLLAVAGMAPGCAALAPTTTTPAQRLATLPSQGLPLQQPVVIRWNAHLVPQVEAATDHDGAFALGLVHGHLRGAQIALMRLVARGRLSEVAGPLATNVDHALRILNFAAAGPAVEAAWPEETRAFTQAFLEGLNTAVARSPLPPEAGLLGLGREPFTTQDLLAISRLAGTDVTWLLWFSLLQQRGSPGFAALWQRVMQAGPGTALDGTTSLLPQLLGSGPHSGSNAVAVSPAHSTSGAALLAGDPHLNLSLPNLWLLAGLRSPSYHWVGLMIPGLPIVGLGRSEHVAWTGTNLRAASSDLFDVSCLPAEAFSTRVETIRRRLWFSTQRPVRTTPLGPVVTDAALVKHRPGDVLALRWAGQEPTDEITALLRASRARNGGEFVASFANFGVSPQNLVWADAQGHIGRLTAATLPDRQGFPADDPVLDATDPAATAPWQHLRDARTLPRLEDPPEGFLATANENPRLWAPDAPSIGFVFSDGDRIARLHHLLQAKPQLSPDDLRTLQTDVHSAKAAALAAALAARLRAVPEASPFLAELAGWAGDYEAESRGALAFELLLGQLLPAILSAQQKQGGGTGTAGVAQKPLGVQTGWGAITTFLLRDLDALPAATRQTVLSEAARRAAILFGRYPDWGSVHRMRVAGWLVNLPVLGKRFVVGDFPTGGSRETPMKTSHGLITGPAPASFGSMARQVVDMGDPDGSWFTLFGGQDGWLGSTAYADQVPLWRARQSIQMPLSATAVRDAFPLVTHLTPAVAPQSHGAQPAGAQPAEAQPAGAPP